MMNKIPAIKSNKDFDEHFDSKIWSSLALEICRRHGLEFSELRRLSSSDHIVFSIDKSLVLKIYRPSRNCFERERQAIEFIGGKTDFKIPEINQVGEIAGLNYLLMTRLGGTQISRYDWLLLPKKEQISFIQKLAVGLQQIHQLNTSLLPSDWAEFVDDRAETFIDRQVSRGVNKTIIAELPQFLEENLKLVPTNTSPVFMHSDLHFGNLCISNLNSVWQIEGLFDFADSRCGFHEYDFLAVGVLIMQGQGDIQREFFKAYGYSESDLDKNFRRRLMMLTMLYETADLKRYAERLKPEAVDFTLNELEKGIWSFCP